jgi:hypothetical protein
MAVRISRFANLRSAIAAAAGLLALDGETLSIFQTRALYSLVHTMSK